MRKILILILFFNLILTVHAQRELNIIDLWAFQRIGNYDVSPDGKLVVFAATSYSIEFNKGNSNIYIINSDGTGLREFKASTKNESTPKFSQDGNRIAYLVGGQIWSSDLNGTNEIQHSEIPTGVSDFVWSNDGSKMLFTSSVYPDCATDECNKNRDEKNENSLVKASLFDELLYRHWNSWREGKWSHLFLLDISSKKHIDLLLGEKLDCPPISLGSAKDFSFSPDGKEIALVVNKDNFVATSTNNDIFIINVDDAQEGRKPPMTKISESNGNDNQPIYSPDGKYIAFVSMLRAGFEADKQDIILYDRTNKVLKNLTSKFDRSAYEIVWSPDSKEIYFNAANEIYRSIYSVNINSGEINEVLIENINANMIFANDGKTMFFKKQSSTFPFEIFAMNLADKSLNQITFLNKKILDELTMNPLETFWTEGADGTPVQSIMVKPPNFNPDGNYPMLFLIHGGPQGHFSDDFHFRWNFQLFAAMGYVVVAPNPRGSIGYGQKFTDEITQDWNGKVYKDLMNTYDYVINNYSFIDENNTFAAGASYGGYMINWIAGNDHRFNALVSHAGVFNLESMYGATEELWFVEWEFGGPPWKNLELYESMSPHRYIHNAKTPTLVIHGALDFRVPEDQGMQLFTSLQRLGVDSKFLYFPDEGHWIAKPQNAILWWNTIFDWFGKYYNRKLQ